MPCCASHVHCGPLRVKRPRPTVETTARTRPPPFGLVSRHYIPKYVHFLRSRCRRRGRTLLSCVTTAAPLMSLLWRCVRDQIRPLMMITVARIGTGNSRLFPITAVARPSVSASRAARPRLGVALGRNCLLFGRFWLFVLYVGC